MCVNLLSIFNNYLLKSLDKRCLLEGFSAFSADGSGIFRAGLRLGYKNREEKRVKKVDTLI